MSSYANVKVCGIKTADDVVACVNAGARYIGFNLFAKSPRSVTNDQAAALGASVPEGICKVALVVNIEDAALDALIADVHVDMIQLHGAETPDRVIQIKERSGLPVMKAVGVSAPEDLPKLDAYAAVADQLLVDAKPPKGAVLPGGNGLAFDWQLIAGRRWAVPWMLAGGLTVQNVAEAMRMTGARQVDVASGVESAPGVKDGAMIAAFCAAALST